MAPLQTSITFRSWDVLSSFLFGRKPCWAPLSSPPWKMLQQVDSDNWFQFFGRNRCEADWTVACRSLAVTNVTILADGDNFPTFQSAGSLSASIDFLNSMLSRADRQSEDSWSTLGWILSGPDELLGLRDDSWTITLSGATSILCSIGPL